MKRADALELIEGALQEFAAEYREGIPAMEEWRKLRASIEDPAPRLTGHNLLVLEAHLRILSANGAQAAVVTLAELSDLTRVYRERINRDKAWDDD